ncbi:hypothetical protein M758_1G264600 [Ceratodon purpureus]|nr:hypothetical protein M758_1G264600 [Ceratodon purpureus]
MALTGKLVLLMGLFVASSVMAAAQPEDPNNQGAVTVHNPALLPLDILVDDKAVRVTTQSATMELAHQEQPLQISVAGGDYEPVAITVHDGDNLMVMPDPANTGILQAYIMQKAGEEPRAQVQPAEEPNPDVRPADGPKSDLRPVAVPRPALRP